MSLIALAFMAALVQPPAVQPAVAVEPVDPMRNKLFPCASGGSLRIQMITQRETLVAVVDPGDGPRQLPLKPWKVGDPPQITWSDGVRTLTWNPGVQLMWMNGAEHRDCGNGFGHDH